MESFSACSFVRLSQSNWYTVSGEIIWHVKIKSNGAQQHTCNVCCWLWWYCKEFYRFNFNISSSICLCSVTFYQKKVRDLKKWKSNKFSWSSGSLSVLYISILGEIQENPSDNCSCGYCTLELSSETDKHYTCCTPRCFLSLQPPTRNTPSHVRLSFTHL